jgi:hypothetical protein
MKNLICERSYECGDDRFVIKLKIYAPEFENGDWRCSYAFKWTERDEEAEHSVVRGDIIDAIVSVSEVVKIKIGNKENELGEKIILSSSFGYSWGRID